LINQAVDGPYDDVLALLVIEEFDGFIDAFEKTDTASKQVE